MLRLEFHHPNHLKYCHRSAAALQIEIDPTGARKRPAPRARLAANRLLKRVDFAQVHGDGRITREIADAALKPLEVDQRFRPYGPKDFSR
jgi:Holliday junction DNA helicase RuvB